MLGNVIDFPNLVRRCETCQWSELCSTTRRGPCREQRTGTTSQFACKAPLKRRTYLFHQGQPLRAFYMVRSGTVKCYLDSEDGCEQIVAFHFPGDLIGFDAVSDGEHQTSAVLLETSAVCVLPYERLNRLASASPKLLAGVMRAGSAQLLEKEHHALLLGQKSAQARLAAFLLYLSRRFRGRGCSAQEFNLPMSRQEIANYLAVAVETMSRLFSDFQRRGVLDVDRRFVRIVSFSKLTAAAMDDTTARASLG